MNNENSKSESVFGKYRVGDELCIKILNILDIVGLIAKVMHSGRQQSTH